jgi:uncharacterized membrane protein
MTNQQSQADKIAKDLLGEGLEKLTDREKIVIQALVNGQSLASNTNVDFEEQSTFWQKMADGLARSVGSWPFIIGFLVFLFAWMALNVFLLQQNGSTFDPYPYILLNLVLSTVASIQAPVIMMSQNRQAVRDRIANDNRFQVHLKNELAVSQLHEKLDTLLSANKAAP